MFEKNLKKLKNLEIHAGIIHEKYNKGVSVADYAIFNEYGTSDIPARPFLNTSFNENQPKYTARIFEIYAKLLAGKSYDNEIKRLGEEIVNDIKLKISSNIPPENSKRTIAKKKSSKTLIDTGIMRSSIAYKIVNKDKMGTSAK